MPPGGDPGMAFGARRIGRPRLQAFARSGLLFTVICDANGTGRAALKVTRATRKRLRLGTTIVARGAVRCVQGETRTVRLKPPRKVAQRLRRRGVRRLAMVLELRMRPTGGRVQELERRITPAPLGSLVVNACRLLGHQMRFTADGATMRWSCSRGCGAGGEKLYPSAAEAQRYASAFDREDRQDLGRRPLLSLLPLALARRRRRR